MNPLWLKAEAEVKAYVLYKDFLSTVTVITCSTEMMSKAKGGFTPSAPSREKLYSFYFCSLKYGLQGSRLLLPWTLVPYLLS